MLAFRMFGSGRRAHFERKAGTAPATAFYRIGSEYPLSTHLGKSGIFEFVLFWLPDVDA